MIVEVKLHHIRRGHPRDGAKCPVALAIRDKIKPGQRVFVREAYVTIDGEEFFFPPEVSLRVKRFDESVAMSPFTFELKGYNGPLLKTTSARTPGRFVAQIRWLKDFKNPQEG